MNFTGNESQNESPNKQNQLEPTTDISSNNSSQNQEQRPITPKRQWSPMRTTTPITESSSPHLHIQSGSPISSSLNKSNQRVESPFSSQPNPLLPKPLSPIKVETLNSNQKQMQNQKQQEEVLTRQQREAIHQQEVQDQIRRQQRWQQQPQNIQQQPQHQQPQQHQQQHLQQPQPQQRHQQQQQPVQNVIYPRIYHKIVLISNSHVSFICRSILALSIWHQHTQMHSHY